MFIVILVIVGLSVLIFGHELGHFLAAKFFKLKVDEFGFGYPPRLFSWTPKNKEGKKSETRYSFNALPFGGFVKIAGENDKIGGDLEKLKDLSPKDKKRIFLFQATWKKSVIILAGVTVNFLIGWFLISVIFMTGTPQALVITEVQKGSPAEQVGILSGDVIEDYTEKVKGDELKAKDFIKSEDFIGFVNVNKGREIEILVKRGNEYLTFGVVPRTQSLLDQGALGVVLVDAGFEGEGFFSAIFNGLKQSAVIFWSVVTAFYELLKNLLTRGSLLQGVVGPVGVFGVAKQAGQIGLVYLIQIIALISINLAVVNLIPFPALDGGRFLMILVEKIKGSPVPLKFEAILNGLGFVLLILIMIAVTTRDVLRLF